MAITIVMVDVDGIINIVIVVVVFVGYCWCCYYDYFVISPATWPIYTVDVRAIINVEVEVPSINIAT